MYAKSNYIKIKINLMKKAAKRHPKRPSGVQKAPKSVKEASKKRQARFTCVLCCFQATKVTRRNALLSRNNLPVREVNRTINITKINLLCTLTSTR